jgi:hypothetical protein
MQENYFQHTLVKNTIPEENETDLIPICPTIEIYGNGRFAKYKQTRHFIVIYAQIKMPTNGLFLYISYGKFKLVP